MTPRNIFSRVGVDYTSPLLIKHGQTHIPVISKAYICVFILLRVKAVHVEAVTDLTSESFLANLQIFTARCGIPSLITSDNGTNFIVANQELQGLTRNCRSCTYF